MIAMDASGLLLETQTIIAELEDRSGYPVTYHADPSLRVLATIKTGTPGSPVHVIRYQPAKSQPDYQIAYECGFALRMFHRAPEDRFHLAANEACLPEVTEDLQRLNPALDSAALDQLSRHLFDGLLLQLRSCPTGMLVDLWLYRNHPGLRMLQAASLQKQVIEYAQCLAEGLERYPQKVVHGNRAMNAAHALFVSDLLNQPHLAVPYKMAGLADIGTQLLADVLAAPLESTDDRRLISAWADRLGVLPWIQWLPFS
jgi:hypothetical protein